MESSWNLGYRGFRPCSFDWDNFQHDPIMEKLVSEHCSFLSKGFAYFFNQRGSEGTRDGWWYHAQEKHETGDQRGPRKKRKISTHKQSAGLHMPTQMILAFPLRFQSGGVTKGKPEEKRKISTHKQTPGLNMPTQKILTLPLRFQSDGATKGTPEARPKN